MAVDGDDDVDASTLMPLETPILKVSRPVAACSRCRNAKIKCDGKLPACSSCEKNGRAAECTSTNDQFARGKERSYVSTLETRMEKLKAKLEEARGRKPSVVSIPDDETTVPSRRQSYSVQQPQTITTTKAQRRQEASAIDDLVSDFGFLSVNATARDFHGFTSTMSYARLILWACSKDPLPEGTTKKLPPRHVAMQLVQHYLSNVFLLLPVFDEASFYALIDNVYSRDARKAEPLDHWMVRMVLAIASASMSESRGDPHFLESIGHVCAALEHAEDVLNPGSLSSIQALVLLTEYAMLDPHHFDSWSLIGAASRAMVDLGLHQDPPKGAQMSKGKLEVRRKIFYCIYALDRSTSLVQSRAFSFSDNSANVKIPFSKAPASQPNSPTPEPQKAWVQSHESALDLINLRQFQSKWYTDLFQSGRSRWDEPYQYIWNTCDAMRKWFESISSTTSTSLRAFFELDLLYSYVYVLSPSPRVPAIHPFAAKLIFEYCTHYADLVLRLIGDPAYTAPLTFYDAMRVYLTGRQFLDVLQHSSDALLNGFVPPHPEVRPATAPPPPLPMPPLPPGENWPHSNTVRSIRCIEQLTEALSLFGIRWGYMSWYQRFRTETTPLLDDLKLRLRNLEARRPSMWHQNSAGSVGSDSGSVTYPSPQSLSNGSIGSYHRSSSTVYTNFANYQQNMAATSSPPHNSHSHSQQYSPSQFPSQGYDMPQTYFQQPMSRQYDWHPPTLTHARSSVSSTGPAAPNQQFAAWMGYGAGGAQGGPDPLDEETAVPPHGNPWQGA